MAKAGRIYHRTESGSQALESQNAALRAETRWLLGLIGSETHLDVIRNGMRRYADDEIAQLLSELEGLGFVGSVAATESHDLDFTGTLSLAALRAAQSAAGH